MTDVDFARRQVALRVLGRMREWGARVRGRVFRCRALAGQLRDGIFVNCDMTVSCNCQDFDSSGRLGDLRAQCFEDIFAGPRAQHFRASLAAGRLPIARCAACPALEELPADEARRLAPVWRLPEGLGVENTVLCNLRCRSCCREEVMRRRGQHRLTPADVEEVARTLARLRARFCAYYNLGEPFASPTIQRELEILRQHNPQLQLFTSTNGLLLDSAEKQAAALMFDHLVVSIDGISTPMVRRYQRGGDFDRAYGNLCALVARRNAQGNAQARHRPLVAWKYVVFRWNHHPSVIRRALELAERSGVDYLQLTFARTPLVGVSWRFHFSPFYRRLAPREGRFRNVVLSRRVGQAVGADPPNCLAGGSRSLLGPPYNLAGGSRSLLGPPYNLAGGSR